jgi:hypothetical protein
VTRPSYALSLLLAGLAGLAGAQVDPAPLRLQLIKEMDARIAAAAARAHLEARMMLDTLLPISFLGMVAELDGPDLNITQIYRQSGAEAAGLRVGDVMLAFAGRPMASKEQLYQEIRCHKPGETVELRVRRDGQEQVLRATLGQRWEEDEEDELQYGDIVPAPFAPHGLPVALDFESDPTGVGSPVLEQLLAGYGEPPRFVVAGDERQHVLRQEAADTTGIRFPMALVRGVDVADVVGHIRFRLVGGAQDRTAGLVLHYQDASNYLVARANAVEGDLRIFRTVDGLRRTLPGGEATVHIDDDAWHTLEFRVEGPKVTATLDGAVTVSSYDTFFLHGGVGLWTKSDAVTEFDDVNFMAP